MRLFVAVWPPAAVLDRVADLARPSRSGVRWTSREQWHVTLRFLGNVEDASAPDVVAALTSAATKVPGGGLATAGPATSTFGRGVLIVPVGGLDEVAAATVAATSSFGVPPDDRPFRGHLTLARARRGADVRPLAGERFDAAWPVDELTLVRSTTTREGSIYDVLARVRLA